MSFVVIENKLLNKLISPKMESLQVIKLKFGLTLLIDSLKKGFIIYGISFLLNCFIETIIVHISFLLLRQVSFGWHSSNNLLCIFWSIFAFPFLAFIWRFISFNLALLLVVWIICHLIIWFNGPIGTKINPISNINHRKLLRHKLKKRIILNTVLIIVVPPSFLPYIVLGVGIQTTTLLIQLLKNGVVTNA